MMISINLNVKESAYDKIMYFLSHLKDDVKIITNPKKNHNPSNRLKQIKILERLSTLDRLVAQSNNKIMVTREIATNTDGMSDDISRY